MKRTAYGKPMLIKSNSQEKNTIKLEKIEAISENYIQDLIFSNPDCLPISDIDEAYNPLIPICTELNTPVGPLDIFMISPNGEIAIIETKLWRNPEARRKVVAQILDYAKELSNWGYEDLQREVNKKLGLKGNSLFNISKEIQGELVLPESDFVDTVSRNLERGKFLLLIVGDGIKEGANAITEFITMYGYMNFTFSMVELSLYKAENLGTLIIPQTIVKTVELSKLIVEIPKGFKISADDLDSSLDVSNTEISPEKQKERQFYTSFWKELTSELQFDDPGQPIPQPRRDQNLFLHPTSTKNAWISAYFMKSNKQIGVYFRTKNDTEGQEIMEFLHQYKDQIIDELGPNLSDDWGPTGGMGVSMHCENIFDEKVRDDLKEYFKDWLNRFINCFRPKLKKMSK